MGDLVSLRMLVIAAERSDLDLWRQGASMASVPIEFLGSEPTAAIERLAAGGVDICVFDSELSEIRRSAIVSAARRVQPTPLLFLTAADRVSRLDGVNGTLTRPKTTADARRLAEICVRTKVPTRVLIVDDSSTMRSIVRKILAASRFALDVYEAAEGIAALSELRSGKFGLVLLDYNMPGFDGIETLVKIRKEVPQVAVVMMTSTMDGAVAERAHAAGALDFLKKPFYPADIDAVLERYYCQHIVVDA